MQALAAALVFRLPAAVEFQHRLPVFPGDGLEFPVGMGGLEAVAEIPLGVQLFPGVGRQLFRLVDIFGVIPAGLVGEFPGVVCLQPCLLLLQQPEEPQLFAVLFRILPQQGNALPQVAVPVGEAVAVAAAAFSEQPFVGHAVAGLINAAPKVHGGEALVTGAVVFFAQKGQQVTPGLQRNRFEIQHNPPWILQVQYVPYFFGDALPREHFALLGAV